MSNNDMTLEKLLLSLEDPMDKSAEESASSSVKVETAKAASSVKDELEGLLTKKASQENTSEESTDMNKQAQEKGAAIADLILGMLKQADEGSHAVIDQTAKLVNEQDAQTEMTPREGKTVTETLKGIVAKGSSTGAVHPEALSMGAVSGDETNPVASLSTSDEFDVNSVESDLGKEAHEKLAAAQALMAQGYDFESAVNLVKAAAEELEQEEGEQIKLATIQALVGEGLDVESALNLTKQAMEILAKQAEEEEKEDKKDKMPENFKKGDKKEDKKEEETEKKASIRALIGSGFSAEEAVKLVG